MQSSLYGLSFSLLPLMGILIASAIIAYKIPFYRSLTSPQVGRYGDLDGLRGLLAVGVFVHHGIYIYQLYATGKWSNPDPTVLQFAGRGSVAFFFMITGFLFWAKAIHSNGKIAFGTFIRSRVRRLMPAYLSATAIILILVAWQSGLVLHDSPLRVAVSVFRWLLGGLGGAPLINGQNTYRFNSGVTWTLQYEWIFYLLLPLTAVCCKSMTRFALLALAAIGVITALIMLSIIDRTEISASYCFIWGMLAAHLFQFARTRAIVTHPAFAVASIVLTLAVILTFHRLVYSVAMLLCVPLFLCVLYQRALPRVLQSRIALFLGHISYSVYLLHGIVLFICTESLHRWRPLTGISVMTFSAILFVMALVLVGVAAISYRWIEHPWLSLPKPAKVSIGANPAAIQVAISSAPRSDAHAEPAAVRASEQRA